MDSGRALLGAIRTSALLNWCPKISLEEQVQGALRKLVEVFLRNKPQIPTFGADRRLILWWRSLWNEGHTELILVLRPWVPFPSRCYSQSYPQPHTQSKRLEDFSGESTQPMREKRKNTSKLLTFHSWNKDTWGTEKLETESIIGKKKLTMKSSQTWRFCLYRQRSAWQQEWKLPRPRHVIMNVAMTRCMADAMSF